MQVVVLPEILWRVPCTFGSQESLHILSSFFFVGQTDETSDDKQQVAASESTAALQTDPGMARQAMKFDPPEHIAGLMQDLANSPEMRVAALKMKEECKEFTGEYAFVDLIQQKLGLK